MDNATVFAKAVQDVAEIQARISTLELSLQQEKQLLTNAVQTQDQARTRLFDVVRPVEAKHEISAAISSQKEITNVRKPEEPKYPVVQRLAKPLEA
jgi:phage protein D